MGLVTPVTVRQIEADEWRRLRSIRLEALMDSPESFITLHAEAAGFPDSVWAERADAGSSGIEQVTMVAIDGADTVGMAVGLSRPGIRPGVVPIVSVFVSPRARRAGVGKSLMGGVERWARSRSVGMTSLWVVDGNEGARKFYEGLGYVATLDRHKISVPPIRWETRLVKNLSG